MNQATTPTRGGASFLKPLLDFWSWVFLLIILAFFEIYAQIETGNSFLFRVYNLQAMAQAQFFNS